MMQLSSHQEKMHHLLAIQQLDWCEFFKQLIQRECVKCETLSLQYGTCWRGLVTLLVSVVCLHNLDLVGLDEVDYGMSH